jgi:molecular chaperone HtpG
MVSKKVEIRSLSYKDGAEAIMWSCDGSPEYSMEPVEKTDRGTDITLYIDDDSKEFLEQDRIDALLKKYCRFLPVQVTSGKEKEWKDGKWVETDKDKVINATEPQWMKKPSELTDDDYRNFYHELYPGQDDPLFWIHLNVDFPFTLTGILYFPKIKNNFEINKNRIQLYCNQVYVTDSVEGVVPEFMMLLQGVIDSPDIPLNVSRSYLQSDAAVKKISGYITKKVASRLEDLFKADRTDYESKWDDIKIFIEYGMLTDEKFCDSAMKFVLLKDTDDKRFTLDEYRTLVQGEQTDKDGNVIYLYSTDKVAQFSYINTAKQRGYNVLQLEGPLANHFVGLLENKIEKTQLVRVDSDVIDNLIRKNDKKEVSLTTLQRSILTTAFQSQVPKIEKAQFLVSFEALSENEQPIVITQNEYMRRMKDMAAVQPGMNFYGDLPDSYNLILNTNHKLVSRILNNAETAISKDVEPIAKSIDDNNSRISTLRDASKDNATEEQKADIKALENEVSKLRDEESAIISKYAETQSDIKQLLDLALLSNGLLKGEDLNSFITRSINLL